MSTKYQMQARSSANAQLYSWLAAAPDFAAAGYVTAGYPGTAQDIALTGGGLDNTGGSGGGGGGVPDKTITLNDGSYVVFNDGSYAVTT